MNCTRVKAGEQEWFIYSEDESEYNRTLQLVILNDPREDTRSFFCSMPLKTGPARDIADALREHHRGAQR